MSTLVVTVAVTYPDGTVVMGQASATVSGASPPAPPPAPVGGDLTDFQRRSQTEARGYR